MMNFAKTAATVFITFVIIGLVMVLLMNRNAVSSH